MQVPVILFNVEYEDLGYLPYPQFHLNYYKITYILSTDAWSHVLPIVHHARSSANFVVFIRVARKDAPTTAPIAQ